MPCLRSFRGSYGKNRLLRTPYSAKTVSVSPKEDLNTSSLNVDSPRGSSLTTAGWHVQTAISLETATRRVPTSGCARGELRSSVRAGFDAASTMLHRSLNGDARRKSSFSSKLRLCRPRHSNDRQIFLIQYPWHSPTPCPIVVGSSRGHTRGSGACPRPGADSRGAAQRENAGYPSFCAKSAPKRSPDLSTGPLNLCSATLQ